MHVEALRRRPPGVCLVFSASCMTGLFYREIKRFGAATRGPVHYTPGGSCSAMRARSRPTGLPSRTPSPGSPSTSSTTTPSSGFSSCSIGIASTSTASSCSHRPSRSDSRIDIPFGPCLQAVMMGEKFNQALLPRARQPTADLGIQLCRLGVGQRLTVCRRSRVAKLATSLHMSLVYASVLHHGKRSAESFPGSQLSISAARFKQNWTPRLLFVSPL